MKVFLSSTAQDLDAYREVADETILRLLHESIVMERFGAEPNMPISECERLARESDVVVCIVAHQYGSVPEKGMGSFTQRETEAAKNAGKDIFAWIVDDNFPWTGSQEQDLLKDPHRRGDPAQVAEVLTAIESLDAFKKWLRRNFVCDTFTTPEDLSTKIAIALAKHAAKGERTSQTQPVSPPLSKERISIARLPTGGAELFGRDKELEILDRVWQDRDTNVVSFVAWSGVGKTALVNHWLKQQMARQNYRGAERAYAWSFFSQGSAERAASADLFIDQALRWFGDQDPTAGSPWDKGERLAAYVRRSRTLLILDGLEPLQHPPGPQEGKLKDPAMQALLIELAAHQPGLCVISTRERIGDLVEFENGTVIQHDLDILSPQAGALILRALNVKGDDEELEQASREFGGHAFSLTLLGSYLDEVLAGDVRRRREIENLFEDTRYGEKAQDMIAAYENWLGEGTELAVLRLLGLFDRPADAASIAALREPPTILGLTEPLEELSAREWNQAVAKLRRIRLLGEASPSEPNTLDAHPLLREHFKQKLKHERPDAWRQGNNRLFEHLRRKARELPETSEEMAPLFHALVHGCAAERIQEAYDSVYRKRILRGAEYFHVMQLGAFGADLAALAGFFETPWSRPHADLTDSVKGFLLVRAGSDLRAVGRLQEAVEPFSVALQTFVANDSPRNASGVAANLSDLYSTIGDLSRAITFGQEAIHLANQSDHEYWKVCTLARMAGVQHQAGNIDAAIGLFKEAEALQEGFLPNYPILYSIQGFRYCELLLGQKCIQEVTERANRTLEIAHEKKFVIDIALDNLSLGRACLLERQISNNYDIAPAVEFLRRALDGLRRAGQMDELPRGLLARAELYRLNGDSERAAQDLTNVFRIASRSGMGLHLADYHLESARLSLAQGDKEKAREHWTTAKEMIDRMGYHRRDKEVEELAQQLSP